MLLGEVEGLATGTGHAFRTQEKPENEGLRLNYWGRDRNGLPMRAKTIPLDISKREVAMGRLGMVLLILLLAYCCVSCSETRSDLVKPGDEIDGMLITAQSSVNWDISTDQYCDYENMLVVAEGIFEVECWARPGSSVFLNNQGMAGESIEELDEYWEDVSIELFINDRKLDLPSFGSITPDPTEGTFVRMWNIVIDEMAPGKHTIHSIIDSPQEDPDASWEVTLNFSVSEEPPVAPELEPVESLSATTRLGQHPYRSESTDLNFMLYLPAEYGESNEESWPLILYLHGYPKGLPRFAMVTREGLPSMLKDVDDFPLIVVSPHRDEGYFEYWYQKENVIPMFQLVEEIQTLLSVDPEQIYLVGESAGGNGVWEIGVQYPDKFAALVPTAGYYGYPFEVPDNICDLKDVPIWAFHGAEDDVVPLYAEQNLVDAVQACGNDDAHITVLPDTGHDLDPDEIFSSELVDWLLAQTVD
jgi:predicted esterase